MSDSEVTPHEIDTLLDAYFNKRTFLSVPEAEALRVVRARLMRDKEEYEMAIRRNQWNR